ncbi:hypothetical protein [Nocardia sp. NPDC050435]
MSFRQIVAGGATRRMHSTFCYHLRVAESEKAVLERVLGAHRTNTLSQA